MKKKKATKKKVNSTSLFLIVCTDCRIRFVEQKVVGFPASCSLCGSKNVSVSPWR